MVASLFTLILTPNESKRLGPLEKPLRMTDMYISLICMSVIQQTVKIWAGWGAGDLILHSLCSPVERKKPLTWAGQVR
jgi:hypothetical protein